ncbi:uncharacterized protein ACA1_121450 [Acanthamoeba castellanii str. Neff]|uniref:Transmembrane protein n=1 Tax=Acanthamoeba castellanii (strain ATCC 30010 / Neff) TaxID=1257118 RepID=L8GFC6_ACACF|nr:uncharacterized protein ACA1_121450 [Acanthamoeba castellanii str. Neff]ELR11438.1 hypothetical protein ACA1_121450 [Acanthamoeba castellanii str. Neff]
MIALLSIIAHAMVVVFSIIEYVFLEIVDVKLIIVVSSGVLAGFFALTVILAPFALIPSLNKSTAPLMLKTFLVSLVIFINWAMFMVCIIHWRSHYQVNSPMECLMDTSPPLDILQPNSTTNIVSMSSSTMTGTNGMGSGNKQLPLNMMHTQCYSQFMAIFLLQATIGSAVQMFIVAMYTSSCVTRRMDYAPVKYSMYPKEQYQFMNNSDLSNNMEMTEIGRMGNSGTSKQQ